MITQYTRLLIDKATQEILHCTSQNLPFTDGWEPIEDDSVEMEAVDFEIDTDYPDVNFIMGIGQPLLRAGKIIENFEVISGQPAVKADASTKVSDKILRISAPKSIEETAIRAELIDNIKAKLITAGATANEVLAEMKKTVPDMPDTFEGLGTIRLIRINRAL